MYHEMIMYAVKYTDGSYGTRRGLPTKDFEAAALFKTVAHARQSARGSAKLAAKLSGGGIQARGPWAHLYEMAPGAEVVQVHVVRSEAPADVYPHVRVEPR